MKEDLKFKVIFFIKISYIVLITTSFFVGFILRENSAGGAEHDFYEHTWPAIQSFKSNFIYTIENYGKFNEGSYPLFHIINAYLNPFSNNIDSFHLSIAIISFSIFAIFALIIKKRFIHIEFIDALLFSSIILIFPFFRSSSFWGITENFGWLFLTLSFYFFLELKDCLNKNLNKKDTINIILFCFFSACGIYSRQTLIFVPIVYLFFLVFNNANKQILLTSIISYIFFALPGLILIFIWGGLYDTQNFPSYIEGYFSYKHVLKNIPIITSLFAFYLMPVLFMEFLDKGVKNFFYEYYKIFILSFIVYLILFLMKQLDYLALYDDSGGVILKLNYLIKKESYFLLLLFSSLGFSILYKIIKEDYKNNLIILIPSLIIYCFPKLLYQEYVEPLIIIIFFLGIKTQLHEIYFRRAFASHTVALSYFSVYLLGAIYIKHFAFS